jgi:hypothetical protein
MQSAPFPLPPLHLPFQSVTQTHGRQDVPPALQPRRQWPEASPGVECGAHFDQAGEHPPSLADVNSSPAQRLCGHVSQHACMRSSTRARVVLGAGLSSRAGGGWCTHRAEATEAALIGHSHHIRQVYGLTLLLSITRSCTARQGRSRDESSPGGCCEMHTLTPGARSLPLCRLRRSVWNGGLGSHAGSHLAALVRGVPLRCHHLPCALSSQVRGFILQ